MLLVSYTRDGDEARRLGIQRDDTVIDIATLTAEYRAVVPGLGAAPATVLDLVHAAPEAVAALTELLTRPVPEAARHPLAEVTLKAPLRPGKIVGVGLNYTEHVAESARTLDTDKELPQRPVLFSKPATAVTGPGEPIWHDGDLTAQLDWECELAVVIGRTAKRVRPEDALDHVFGYSIVNDISARDQRRSGQWFYSKGQDSYAPLGPAVRTADDVPDPHALDLSLRVNGEVKQKGNTRHMLFRIPELIADISAGMTLEPGDVIATGSPAGVGASFTPQQFLTPGDIVEATVESIGTLRNPVVDAR
ncbi:fumarylacetoacetate hydrolase family protein [Streptomyces sp. NBC_00873]|uniref:fumarylacetoacetate hydrolase family protein n=1 Tax=unclassified Streptomyces TaxID=2593676 RepID=UPI0038665408|nr:fumarylacetoacetate hydrolase family protein [Streptomyces sp. NBC_00873]WSY96729.1 fumarylacetoacetate hydrolase family protein [Streptomyces sp. NBC_00873]WTA41497.1 fumarylacetoacetate hydrolase family protein [Streptomyces sp. NBC_00842]WTA48399.1 fumarylacetoacetate hydrolase family protein [Streptomyces sp. NBC_00842]